MERIDFKQDYKLVWLVKQVCPYCKKKIFIEKINDSFEEGDVLSCPKCGKEFELGDESFDDYIPEEDGGIWENNEQHV